MRKIFNLFRWRRARMERDLDRELRYHVDRRVQDLMEAGVGHDEARRRAAIELGGHVHIREDVRDTWIWRWLDDGGRDAGYAARALLRSPGFSTVAIITLALGIGANTAIFSLVNAVLLRALPFPDSDRLAVIWAHRADRTLSPPANADVAAWRGHSQSFGRLAAFVAGTADLADGGDPERIGAAGVTAGFFETLGVTPLLGRPLTPEEEAPGGSPVALIGYGLGSGASAAILRSLARAFPSTATGARSLVSFRRSLIFRGAPSGRPSSPLPAGPKSGCLWPFAHMATGLVGPTGTRAPSAV